VNQPVAAGPPCCACDAGPIAIGVAIRPTRTVIATSNLAGRVLDQEEFPTDPDPEKTLLGIISSVRKFPNGTRLP